MSNTDHFQEARYVGDGVYAGHDGYQVWVWTSNGVVESEPIALETEVLEKLVRFNDELRKRRQEQT